MLQVRKAHERGHADHGWLNTFHTFSFADYRDPAHMGFRALRVMNEDWVAPGTGFGMHGHRDMEIITYVLSGTLEHQDSLGNGSLLRAGEFQRMSAGTGVRHSEFNPSPAVRTSAHPEDKGTPPEGEPVHLYQIWLLPDRKGIEPGYEQKHFPVEEQRGRLRLVASPGGTDGSLRIHQNASVYLARLAPGDSVPHNLASGRHAWLQVLSGRVGANRTQLHAGDGLAVSGEPCLAISAEETAEVMLFDLV